MAGGKKNKKKKGSGRRLSLTERRRREQVQELQRQARKLMMAHRWPIREVVINDTWQEAQLASIVVCREREDGQLAAAMFLVDLGCMGVKDTFANSALNWDHYTRLRDAVGGEHAGEAIECSPQMAVKIIEEAVAWGQRFGFEPPALFAVSKLLFKGVEPGDEAVPVGHDGMPVFSPGPEDDIYAIQAKLEGLVGPEGYLYQPPPWLQDDLA